jgi:putative membrane protein
MFNSLSEKTIFRLVLGLSLVVFALVLLLDSKVLPRPETLPAFAAWLPRLNAAINFTCSVLLVLSYRAIRQKRVDTHRKLNLLTFVLSSLFLVSYVLYHWMSDETKFPADNPLRPVYISLLVSHIILAALVLPLVLLTFWYGLNNMVEKHRRIARWTFPIWLYVTVTGVLVYFMIAPHYPH